MIQMIQNRYKDGERFGPDVFSTTEQDALERLVKFELGYGGYVTNIEERGPNLHVSVETLVMNCRDTTEFVGTRNEMRNLTALAGIALTNHGSSDKSKDVAFDKVIEITGGSPLLIKMGSGIIVGQYTVRNVCLAALGVKGDETYYQALLKMRLEDMLAALLMVDAGDCDLETAIALAN